jgi:hypothetical protein
VYVPPTSIAEHPTGKIVISDEGFMDLVAYDIRQSRYWSWNLHSIGLGEDYRTRYVMKRRFSLK